MKVQEYSKFAGRVCVVTGAASGIGRALALALARNGAIIAVSDVNAEGLKETVDLAGGHATNRIKSDVLDVADGDAILTYAKEIRDSIGPTTHVFNVAGLTRIGRFDETSIESMEKVMDVNFWGVVRMSKAFLPQLRETGGSLTNISSVFGFIGFEGQTHYCASKFGVRGFTETLAIELADTNVSVHSVHPGGVATNISRNAEVDALPDQVTDKKEMDDFFDSMAGTTPDEAAEVILKGVARGQKRILIGKDAHVISAIQRLFPSAYSGILRWLAERRTTSKPGPKP